MALSNDSTNGSGLDLDEEWITPSDAAWILSNAFLIMTMQSGFGLLEAGYVSIKNITNIMVKNVVDVCMGGITYWAVGYGLSFGEDGNSLVGFGSFFATAPSTHSQGSFYTKYIFQFSFATAATTIVSGAVAERMKLTTYMVFSVLNVFVYCLPAHWAWHKDGFLFKMGFHDFAGACVVHMSGGASALVATFLVGPRIGRFDPATVKDHNSLCSPVTALTGTFMLWWAWLAFNCGSTFAIDGLAWKTAAKIAVNTMNGSIGGGISTMILSMLTRREKGRMIIDVNYIISGLLGGLVAVTAGCSLITPGMPLIVGACGALIAVAVSKLLEYLHLDDPVGAIPVHFCSGIFSTLIVGILGKSDFGELKEGRAGVFVNGTFEQLAVQAFGVLVIGAWSALFTFLLFGLFKLTIGYRVDEEEERLGSDYIEHNIKQQSSVSSQIEKAFKDVMNEHKIDDMSPVLTELFGKLVSAQKRNEKGHGGGGGGIRYLHHGGAGEVLPAYDSPRSRSNNRHYRKHSRKHNNTRSMIVPMYLEDIEDIERDYAKKLRDAARAKNGRQKY